MSRLVHWSVATLLLAVTLVASGPLDGDGSSLLKQICDNTKKPSKRLATVDELRELVTLVNSDLVSCPERTKSAIIDLSNLISDHEADICSQDSANAIADYYGQYLANKDASTKSLLKYPKAMKKFFISYGLKVSSFCRKQAIDLLVSDSDHLVTGRDFEELAEFSGEKGYIAIFLNDPSNQNSYNDLVLPKRFIKMMDSFGRLNAGEDDKVFLELATTKRIKRLQAVCERRFRPLYRDLILPLVTLSTIGFNFKAEDLKRDLEVNKKVYEWYRIVFFCESMNGVEFFQMPEDEMKAAGSSRQLVRILDKKEAQELREGSLSKADVALEDLKQIEYKAQFKPMPLVEKVYDAKDSTLNKAILAFRKQSRNANDPDLARKMLKVAKNQMNRGGIKLISKFTGMKNLPADGKLTSVDLIKVLDDYVHAMETGDSKAVSSLSNVWGNPDRHWAIRHSWVPFLLFVIGVFIWAGVTGHG